MGFSSEVRANFFFSEILGSQSSRLRAWIFGFLCTIALVYICNVQQFGCFFILENVMGCQSLLQILGVGWLSGIKVIAIYLTFKSLIL